MPGHPDKARLMAPHKAEGYPDPAPATSPAPHILEHRHMQRHDILEYLKALLHERFDVDPAGLTGKTTQQEIGIDSLLMVDMMLDIETGLEFTFASMDLPRNPDLDTIVDLIERNLHAKPTA